MKALCLALCVALAATGARAAPLRDTAFWRHEFLAHPEWWFTDAAMALGSQPGSASGDPVYASPDPAPDVYGPLVWGSIHGYWFTDAQTQKIDLRIKYLEDKATKQCVTETNAETRKVLGAAPTLWVGVGLALVVGVAGGFYLGRR